LSSPSENLPPTSLLENPAPSPPIYFCVYSKDKKRRLEDSLVTPRLGNKFLNAAQNLLGFDTNPIYALLHEAIYCQKQPSRWSAERVAREHYPAFDVEATMSGDRPVMFFGEMMYQGMFDDFSQLVPLKETAELLASFEQWPRLYDLEKLKANKVPVAAAMYYDDIV